MRTWNAVALTIVTFAAVPLAAPFTGGSVAFAQVQARVQFDVGNVAIGYTDGYWDRGHQWHAWERAEHREAYRAHKEAEFHEWRHDRDKDMGWHERR